MNRLSFTRSRTRLGALLLSLGFLLGASAICAQAPLADGQVIKIDQAAGKITIKHGPLKQFGMEEGMTMVYRATDPSMLKATKPGETRNPVPCPPAWFSGTMTSAAICHATAT
jgi:hypothetical protein